MLFHSVNYNSVVYVHCTLYILYKQYVLQVQCMIVLKIGVFVVVVVQYCSTQCTVYLQQGFRLKYLQTIYFKYCSVLSDRHGTYLINPSRSW